MRYRTPTQLHASLYMRDKKSSAGSKVGRDTKTKTKRMSKAVVAGTIKKKK